MLIFADMVSAQTVNSGTLRYFWSKMQLLNYLKLLSKGALTNIVDEINFMKTKFYVGKQMEE